MAPSSLPVTFTVNGAASCATVVIGLAGGGMVGALFVGPVQECAGDALVRGTRPVPVVATVKSRLLLSLSVQPDALRTPPFVESSATLLLMVVPPSPLLATPHAARSAMLAFGSVHSVAVAPQARLALILARATLPLAADMLRLPEVRSAVNVAPSVPAPPSLISRYLPGAIVVVAGNAKMFEADVPKLLVAAPYCRDHPVMSTVEPPLLNSSTK